MRPEALTTTDKPAAAQHAADAAQDLSLYANQLPAVKPERGSGSSNLTLPKVELIDTSAKPDQSITATPQSAGVWGRLAQGTSELSSSIVSGVSHGATEAYQVGSTVESAVADGAKATMTAVADAGSAVAHQGKLLSEGVATGAVLDPINGSSQLINHAFGTQIGQIQFSNQQEVDSSVAGKIGETAGAVADFAAVSVATGGAADLVGLTGVAATTASLAAAGAIEGGVLNPTANNDPNFFEDRALNTVVGASSGALGGAAGRLLAGTSGQIGSALLAKATLASGSALIGGALGAGTEEAASLAGTGKSATGSDLAWSAGIGMASGALGSWMSSTGAADKGVPKTDTAKPVPAATAGDTTTLTSDNSLGNNQKPTDAAAKPSDATAPKVAEIQPVALDNSGRPVSEGNAERVAEQHPPLSASELSTQRAALQTDLEHYNAGSDGKSVAQALADSPMSAAQTETVLNVLAETRSSFLKPDASGKVAPQQQDNYLHTIGELKEGLESSKANGLSPQQTQEALLSGILSDSHKSGFSRINGGNFFTHHLDGALAADAILPRYGVSPEETGAVRQAILEHQISPPNFMSRMYANEIKAGMAKAGVTPTEAQQADINHIQQLMADPFGSPSTTDANGVRKLNFTPDEQNLLKTYVGEGTQNWYIPSSKPGMVGIAADVFDNYLPETNEAGAATKGPFKIAALRGPNENPPDLSLASAVSGIQENMRQSLGLLTDTDQARAVGRMSQADTVYQQAKTSTAAWLESTGVPVNADTPYLNKPLTPPPANATAQQMQEWRHTPEAELGTKIQQHFAQELLAMRMRS